MTYIVNWDAQVKICLDVYQGGLGHTHTEYGLSVQDLLYHQPGWIESHKVNWDAQVKIF